VYCVRVRVVRWKEEVARVIDAASVARRFEQRRRIDCCSILEIGGRAEDLCQQRHPGRTIGIRERPIRLPGSFAVFDGLWYQTPDYCVPAIQLGRLLSNAISEYTVGATLVCVCREDTVCAYKYTAINKPIARAARFRGLASFAPLPSRRVQEIKSATTITQPPVPIQ